MYTQSIKKLNYKGGRIVKHNNYSLGLDIGITSVGWGIIDEKSNVVAAGVRLFEEANASDNLTRRTQRGSRRIKRRRQHRVERMRRLLMRNGFIDDSFIPNNNPYELRVKGLQEKLNDHELATALLHLVKRRGSHLETVEEDEKGSEKEALKSKQTLERNRRILRKTKKHVCEIQLEKLRKEGSVRGPDNIFHTDDYLAEAEAIIDKQSISNDLAKAILELIGKRRHYSEGPGSITSPTPYGRFRRDENGNIQEYNLIELMRGKWDMIQYT